MTPARSTSTGGARGPGRSPGRALFLLSELVRRDFKGRYAGSLLGFLWSFLQPLWMLALFGFVFATVLKVPLVGERTSHFAVFLFAGLLPWMAIQEGVVRATTSITDNAALVRKISFPSEQLPLSVTLTAMLHQAIAALVFVAVLVVFGELEWRSLHWLALAVPAQFAMTWGLGLLLGGLQVLFRDAVQLVGMVMQAWFYLTPIVYPVSLVPQSLRLWIDLNPLTALVGLYRAALIGGAFPSRTGLAVLLASAVALLASGLWVFRRVQPAFADEA